MIVTIPKPDQPPVDLAAECVERGCKRPHSHGEARTRGTHRCPCRPCRSARYSRDKRRQYAKDRGRVAPQYVPADDVRAHIATLIDTGATLGMIAAAAGVNRDTLSRLVNDPARMVQTPIRARILAVRPSDVDDTGTPLGAHRRLQALAALGWSSAQIAAASGMHQRVVLAYTTGTSAIRTSARRRIIAVYRLLSEQRPPSATAGQRSAISFARNRAQLLGWAVPAAWDDIDLDDAPSMGEPDPALTPTGRRSPSAIHPDDIAWMLRTCSTSWEAAERLGISREYVLKLADRHGIDLPAHIRVNDADRAHINRERSKAA